MVSTKASGKKLDAGTVVAELLSFVIPGMELVCRLRMGLSEEEPLIHSHIYARIFAPANCW